MYFKIIVAFDSKRGIGLNNQIPWKLSDDLKHFKEITTKVPKDSYYKYINMVVMGRKTWDSLPPQYKPLPNRLNVILSNNPNFKAETKTKTETEQEAEQDKENEQEQETSLAEANEYIRVISDFDQIYDFNEFSSNDGSIRKIHDIFVIGGESLYKHAVSSPYCNTIYTTEIYTDFKCDKFFPQFKTITHKIPITSQETNHWDGFIMTDVSDIKHNQISNLHYRFITYQHHYRGTNSIKQWRNQEEETYLKTMNDILVLGYERVDRTMIGTYVLPGICLKYDISQYFPISTTKKMALRWIFEELKLYISGKTDSKILSNQGIKIWDGNTSRQFLDKRGLVDYPEGDMGETYGFNFRHFGGQYKDCQT